MEDQMTALQEQFNTAQEHLKSAAEIVQTMFGGKNAIPPAAKAQYNATTKIEEAYMWMANGVQSMIQFDKQVESAATGMANAPAGPQPKVLDGKE